MDNYVGKSICFICNGEVLLRDDRDFTGGVAVCPKDARKVFRSLMAVQRANVHKCLEASIGNSPREETR
jgi:hypothetical protein